MYDNQFDMYTVFEKISPMFYIHLTLQKFNPIGK